MCVGIPMQVVRCDFGFAICRAADGEHEIDMRLVGDLEPGAWVMTFLGAARERMSEDMALKTQDALKGLAMAMNGEAGFEAFFADLIDREPQWPAHLVSDTKEDTDR